MALAGPLSVWRDPWGRPVRRRDFIKLPGGAAAGNVEAIRAAARTRGVEIVARELHGADDLPLTFDDVKSVGAQAAIFMTDNVMFGRREEVAALARARKLPSIHSPEAEGRIAGPAGVDPYPITLFARAFSVTAPSCRLICPSWHASTISWQIVTRRVPHIPS